MTSKWFEDKETACPCCGQNAMDPMLMRSLDHMREILNRPIILNSAFRCEKHNAEVGGKSDSAHLLGMAVDIKIDNNEERHMILKTAYRLGFSRVGVAKTFVHLDNADQFLPSPRCWLY